MTAPQPTSCAGDRRLCAKRYDAVTFLTAHNAYAREGQFDKPDQVLSIEDQLAVGVRGFMLDVHLDPKSNALVLCHSNCAGGRLPFDHTLAQFRRFLDRHPGEIVTLIIEDNTENDRIYAGLLASEVGPQLHLQGRGNPWPTLGEMVAANTRLVVFTENNRNDAQQPDGAERFPGYHIAYDHLFDTPYGFVPTPEDPLPCPLLRGDPANSLFLINHFITRKWIPMETRKRGNISLPGRITACLDTTGRHPNFVAIDWVGGEGYDGVRRAVDELNGIASDRFQ